MIVYQVIDHVALFVGSLAVFVATVTMYLNAVRTNRRVTALTHRFGDVIDELEREIRTLQDKAENDG
jgi:hypothetical protein